jgi:hypothetical protein
MNGAYRVAGLIVPSHRIIGNEVGRSLAPGAGSIHVMGRGRRRRSRGWAILLAPVLLVAGGVAALFMWPFR